MTEMIVTDRRDDEAVADVQQEALVLEQDAVIVEGEDLRPERWHPVDLARQLQRRDHHPVDRKQDEQRPRRAATA